MKDNALGYNHKKLYNKKIYNKKIYDKKLSAFTPRDITRLFSNVSTEDVKFALSTLINYGGIFMIQEKQKNGPGRPSGKLYSANYYILKQLLDNYYR